VLEPLKWQLPAAYQTDKYLKVMSWDAQLYLACVHCAWEQRYDLAFAGVADSAAELPCGRCKQRGLQLVRHLEHRAYRCHDCGAHFETDTTGFDQVRCPNCFSTRLALRASEIVPPFPPRFGQGLSAKDHPWGELVVEDFNELNLEISATNLYPDFPLHALMATKFWRRLRLYGGYASQADRALALNVEGNLLRDYFRRTQELAAGLESLALFEECVELTDEPTQRALVEHNVAMCIYSMLTAYPENVLTILTQRPMLRQDAIAAAERALEIFERGPDRAEPTFRTQAARIHHLLGDLYMSGESDDAQRRQALDHYTRALNSRALPPRLETFVKLSRGVTLAEMSQLTPAERKQAIRDLRQVIALDESDRAWTDKIGPLYNLASLYIQDNQPKAALEYLEQAAAYVLDEIEALTDETTLQQKGRQYVRVFDLLARLYVQLGKPEKGLDATEALRAATVRLHTMSEPDRHARAKEAAAASLETVFGAMLRGKPGHTRVSKLQLPSVIPTLDKFMPAIQEERTVLLSLTVHAGHVTALVVTPAPRGRTQLLAQQWQLDANELTDVLTRFATQSFVAEPNLRNVVAVSEEGTEPVEFEAHVERLCRAAYANLIAPVLPLLETSGATRIAVCAPGVLSHLPFEAFLAPTTPAQFLLENFRVFYLPSLQLGADLAARPSPRAEGRLLVVGYADYDLPATQREVHAIADLWSGDVTLLEGTQCTKKQVLEALESEYDYIHFSCHGSFDLINPLDSALHLVRNPERDRQRVTARDLLDVRFQHAPLVTLSACSSALTSYDLVNDCTGLTGSFLRAGARGIIGSRWSVLDTVAYALMTKFYSNLKTDSSPQHCLAAIQREMRATHRIEDWAAFGYLGIS
jgi:CHAT domain-containing protein/tetratricopeptide (TPR) repeat protein